MDPSDFGSDWWKKNDRLKRRLGLPSFTPPRFEDCIYTFQVTSDLEAKFGCNIRFVGFNATYGDDWEVRVDGDPVMEIGRYRDTEGNTVYEMTSTRFEQKIRTFLK